MSSLNLRSDKKRLTFFLCEWRLILNESGETGVYYDEKGHPMLGFALVRDPKFQDHVAWMAWKDQTRNLHLENRDGLTPEQRFFVGNAQWACENDRPENLRVNAITDPHSPGKYRVNGLVVNLPEFEKAFACKPAQPMVKENRCRIW